METKTLEQQLSELKSGLENFTKEQLQNEIKSLQENIAKLGDKVDKKEIETLQGTLNEIKAATDKLSEWQVKKDEADKKNQEFLDKISAERKRKPFGASEKTEVKSFNEILGETIERNAKDIQEFRPLTGKEGSHQEAFSFYTEEEKKSLETKAGKEFEVKAVGDMSISANFPNATALYQDVRGPMIENPYNRVWLADVLPNGTSGGTQVVYPKESVGEGGVASWTDYTQNKAQVDFDITSATSPFVWGAGYVIIQRDMLDDIPFMTSYLQNRLLISLKTWENGFILDGAGTVPGLQDVASPYNGTLTAPVDRLIDAAYGQIIDATSEFYNGTHAIVRSRDLITKIALNKATGSGEYDLPSGTVVFRPDGTVSIGNLSVVGTTAVPSDTFYALDSRATMFIRRIAPELRMFEDATLAKKNQIMFRIEERATLVVFNNAAIVKGVLQTS